MSALQPDLSIFSQIAFSAEFKSGSKSSRGFLTVCMMLHQDTQIALFQLYEKRGRGGKEQQKAEMKGGGVKDIVKHFIKCP